MFRKTGLGQQISILPGPTPEGGAQPAAGQSGARRGGIETDATLDPGHDPERRRPRPTTTQPAPGKGR